MSERERTRCLYDTRQSKTAWAHSQYYKNGSILTDWYPSTTSTMGEDAYEQTVDTVTANFAKRIAAGEIINNPFSREHLVNTWPPTITFDMKEINPSNSNEYWWIRGPLRLPSTGVDDLSVVRSYYPQIDSAFESAKNLAVTQAHANIDESAMLALATVAESQKSAASLLAISRKALQIFKKVKRLDLVGLKKEISPKELSERYMELRYALRPLIYDAVGVMKALDSERRHVRQTYRGYAEEKTSSVGTPTNIATGINKLYCKRTKSWEYTVSARAGVLCDVAVSEVQIWGADQVLETLWELCPFSFIADWFYNIGDTIAALTPNAGVKQRASWVTVRETFIHTYTFDQPYVSGSSWNTQASFAQDGKHVQKEVNTTRLVEPSVSVFPEVNLRLDGYKLTDLGIILNKMFR